MDTASADKAGETRALDRGVARRHAFLQAARQVFLDQGYEAASVNDIVRLAGGSLATLYAQFGNKEGLFLAVTQDQQERFVRAIMPAPVDHLPLAEGLQQIGEHYTQAILARENLAFFRVMVGEGRKFPQLLQRYTGQGLERARESVASYIRIAAPDAQEPSAMAGYFLELLRSRHHYHALADDSYALTSDEISAHVAQATKFFLAAMRGLRD
ncbi:MAG: TetR/AcrR family transcriptional regulator [Hyphomonadaceae bacterium]